MLVQPPVSLFASRMYFQARNIYDFIWLISSNTTLQDLIACVRYGIAIVHKMIVHSLTTMLFMHGDDRIEKSG